MHTQVLNKVEQLKSQRASVRNCVEICVKDFTPVIGVHSGTGLLAVAFHTIGGEVLDLTNNQNSVDQVDTGDEMVTFSHSVKLMLKVMRIISDESSLGPATNT